MGKGVVRPHARCRAAGRSAGRRTGASRRLPELFQIRAQLQTLLALKLIQPRDERFFLVLQQALARSPSSSGTRRSSWMRARCRPAAAEPGGVRAPSAPAASGSGRLAERRRSLEPHGGQCRARPVAVRAAGQGCARGAAPQAAAPSQPDDPAPRRNASIVVSEPVRAGQQIYAEDGDLIVLAPVSPGAEVAADGHVHVYSRLRGRAHAGSRATARRASSATSSRRSWSRSPACGWSTKTSMPVSWASACRSAGWAARS